VFMQKNRERAMNAPLRGEIEARVCFETTLDHASILGTGGFGGTRGMWIARRRPMRLVVGTDAFMVYSPFGWEYVFRGCESSIAFSQAPSFLVNRDWIVITGQNGARQVQIAVTKKDSLPEIWQALAGTGAAPGPPFDP
jgi:hypothetical protein